MRALKEIQDRINNLKSNLPNIMNKKGSFEISYEIKILEDYLNNPEVSLRKKIEELSYSDKKTELIYRWIMGDAV